MDIIKPFKETDVKRLLTLALFYNNATKVIQGRSNPIRVPEGCPFDKEKLMCMYDPETFGSVHRAVKILYFYKKIAIQRILFQISSKNTTQYRFYIVEIPNNMRIVYVKFYSQDGEQLQLSFHIKASKLDRYLEGSKNYKMEWKKKKNPRYVIHKMWM